MTMPNISNRLRLLLTLVCLVWLLSLVEYEALGEKLNNVLWLPLILVLSLQIFDRCFMAYKWRLLINAVVPPQLGLFAATRLYFISSFFGLLVPLGGVGPDVVRYLKLKDFGVPKNAGLASMVVERLLGILGTLLATFLACVLFLFLARKSAFSDTVAWILLISLVILLGVLWLLFSQRNRSFMKDLIRRFKMFQAGRLADILAELRMYHERVPTLLLVGFYSFLEQGVGVLAFYFSALAFGLDVSLLTCMMVIPVAAAVARLPISLWGIGVREGIEVALFVQLTPLSVTEVLTASFTMTLLYFAAVLPGLYWWYRDPSYQAVLGSQQQGTDPHL